MNENEPKHGMNDDVETLRAIGNGAILEGTTRVLTDEQAARVKANARLIERFDRSRLVTERKSDDPFAAIWRELQRFAGEDAARRATSEQGVTDEARVKALRNEVRLADAYYLSYRDADEVIDPVILYYGAYALAKAVCYSSLPISKYEQWQKRPTHGISSRIGTSLLNSAIVFQNNGTAQAFSYALGGDAPRDVTMSAADLFRGVPELNAILHDVGLGGTSAMPIFRSPDEDELALRAFPQYENVHIYAEEDYTAEDFERDVPATWPLFSRGAVLQMAARQISWPTKVGGEAELLFMAVRTPEGLFFQRRLPGGFYIPEMALHLILLHLLADYARYRPDEWIEMVDAHSDEYALVREFINVSEGKLPNLILNELTWRTFVFSHT